MPYKLIDIKGHPVQYSETWILSEEVIRLSVALLVDERLEKGLANKWPVFVSYDLSRGITFFFCPVEGSDDWSFHFTVSSGVTPVIPKAFNDVLQSQKSVGFKALKHNPFPYP